MAKWDNKNLKQLWSTTTIQTISLVKPQTLYKEITVTEVDGSLCPGLGQTQKWSRVKPINRIPSTDVPLLISSCQTDIKLVVHGVLPKIEYGCR